MNKRWSILDTPSSELVQALSLALSIEPPLATLLVQRGITSFDEAKAFFRPDIELLHSPFQMKDMDKAVERIQHAIKNGETIVIYGDYDVDGTTSVALVYGYLSQFYSALKYYVPDRYTEGYGVSRKGIDTAKEWGATLLITLDCGIKAGEVIQYAASLGIDTIVCDHHLPEDELPAAVAVLDPKRYDCPYPFKELSGCGVGFKLIHAVTTVMAWPEGALWEQLDLVAISTCADIVPMIGENRILTYFGLQQLNQRPRPGIQALIDCIGYKPPIDVHKIVFGFAPRINAAGRIHHALYAVQLLLAEAGEQADGLVEVVNQYNQERRGADEAITQEALEMIESLNQKKAYVSSVVYKKDWNKGVIGIVASRCIEHYHRPTIVLTQSQGKTAGSARSIPGFDLYEALGKCSDLLTQFGGHKYAAGLTMPSENIELFREKFDAVVRSTVSPQNLVPTITIDIEITLSDINRKFYSIVQQMAPFGPLNMQPVFITRAVRVVRPVRHMKEKHIKIWLQEQNSAQVWEAVGFNLATGAGWKPGDEVDICYSISENEYQQVKTIQLMLRDIRYTEKVL
ncbi:MAG: single-stranded-DNA-specific exonuclease RecJ [Cytophagaceae bacterium]|jgi:single-stranded-DNA-specific exonuclease|nr:single-stranded-DNA-specific exonuclease RecJ [Cytophagaceae bacterium]